MAKKSNPKAKTRRAPPKPGCTTTEILYSILWKNRKDGLRGDEWLDKDEFLKGHRNGNFTCFHLNWLLNQYPHLVKVCKLADEGMKYFEENPWAFYMFWKSLGVRISGTRYHHAKYPPKITKQSKDRMAVLMRTLGTPYLESIRLVRDVFDEEALENLDDISAYVDLNRNPMNL